MTTATNFSALESSALVDCVQTWRYSTDTRQYGFFLAKKDRASQTTIIDDIGPDRATNTNSRTPDTFMPGIGYSWVIGSLASYETGFFEGVDPPDQYVCFADPSTYNEYPGWMLRNLLVLIRLRWKLDNVQILCYRDSQARRDDARSLILRLTLDQDIKKQVSSNETALAHALPKVSGWERSSTGKLSSKIANLGEYLNPQRYDSFTSS